MSDNIDTQNFGVHAWQPDMGNDLPSGYMVVNQERLRAEANELQVTINKLRTALDAANKRAGELESEIAEADASFDELRLQVKDLRARHALLKAECEAWVDWEKRHAVQLARFGSDPVLSAARKATDDGRGLEQV